MLSSAWTPFSFYTTGGAWRQHLSEPGRSSGSHPTTELLLLVQRCPEASRPEVAATSTPCSLKPHSHAFLITSSVTPSRVPARTSTLVWAIQDGKHSGTNQVEQVAGVVPGTPAINGSLHHDGAGAMWHRSPGPDLLPPHNTGQRVAAERHSLPWAPAAISLTSDV